MNLRIFLIIISCSVLSSCQNTAVVSKSPLQKRKYNKGFHVNFRPINPFSKGGKGQDTIAFMPPLMNNRLEKSAILESGSIGSLSKHAFQDVNSASSLRNARKEARIQIKARMTQGMDDTPEPGGEWMEEERSRKVHPLGIAGIITGLVGLIVLGIILGTLSIIFGTIAVVKTVNHPDEFKGLAVGIIAIALGILDIVALIVILILFL